MASGSEGRQINGKSIWEQIRDPNSKHDQAMTLYDEWAEHYDKDHPSSEYHSPMIISKLVQEILGERMDANIIDLAAGTGLIGMEVHTLGYQNLDALDANQKMLEKANEKKIYKHIICSMLGPDKIGIEDDTYDVAVLGGSFIGSSHMDEACLAEVKRIIKPGGYFITGISDRAFKNLPNLLSTIQCFEDKGLWRRQYHRADSYHRDLNAEYFIFQILP